MSDALRFQVNSQGRCPHCGVTVRFTEPDGKSPNGTFVDPKFDGQLTEVATAKCPSCGRPVVGMNAYSRTSNDFVFRGSRFIYPSVAYRQQPAADIPSNIRSDYEEAVLVLADSEKASAALSRRCLQSLLREAAAIKSKDLSDQIDEVLPTLPGYLQPQLDAVRNIGNFAAHVQKSKATGEIIDVEPGEAEWNLDVLDLLFDFYYVQPKIAQEKRDALNKKLAEVGKPPMK